VSAPHEGDDLYAPRTHSISHFPCNSTAMPRIRGKVRAQGARDENRVGLAAQESCGSMKDGTPMAGRLRPGDRGGILDVRIAPSARSALRDQLGEGDDG
jgi:hypothetical protein